MLITLPSLGVPGALLLTRGDGEQAAILRGVTAISRVVLILRTSYHEVRQGALPVMGKVLGELRFREE